MTSFLHRSRRPEGVLRSDTHFSSSIFTYLINDESSAPLLALTTLLLDDVQNKGDVQGLRSWYEGERRDIKDQRGTIGGRIGTEVGFAVGVRTSKDQQGMVCYRVWHRSIRTGVMLDFVDEG